MDVFFVLSGFLITAILLDIRENAYHSRAQHVLRFYAARALRILPLYFLILTLILILHESLGAKASSEWIPLLTFTLNFHFFQQQYWGDLTTHLWTLSIEEQFYFVWPWVILFLNKKYLPFFFCALIATGFLFQCVVTDLEYGYLPTYTCVDAFGIGAVMAWVARERCDLIIPAYRILKVLGIVSLAILLFAALFPDLFFLAPQRTLRSLAAAWPIMFVVLRHNEGTIHEYPVFNNRILLFLGKISYGMYMFHLFFPWMYYQINEPINVFLPESMNGYLWLITFAENFILLILISWLSYTLFEKPILRLKRIAPNSKKTGIPQPTSTVG